MKSVVGVWAAALALAVLLGARPAEGLETKEVKGKVTGVCPMGSVLKVKTCCHAGGKEMTFNVPEKLRKQVKELKVGNTVQVSYDECPKTKKLTLVAVKKL